MKTDCTISAKNCCVYFCTVAFKGFSHNFNLSWIHIKVFKGFKKNVSNVIFVLKRKKYFYFVNFTERPENRNLEPFTPCTVRQPVYQNSGHSVCRKIRYLYHSNATLKIQKTLKFKDLTHKNTILWRWQTFYVWGGEFLLILNLCRTGN